jgi:hypothetical protein
MTNLKTRAEEATAYVRDGAESLRRDVARAVGEKAALPVRSMRRHPAEWGLALAAVLATAATASAAAVVALRRRRRR